MMDQSNAATPARPALAGIRPTRGIADHVQQQLKSAVHKARLGHAEELAAIRRLDDQARRLERSADGPGFDALVAEERRRSHEYGGRTVSGWAKPAVQPDLFSAATAG